MGVFTYFLSANLVHLAPVMLTFLRRYDTCCSGIATTTLLIKAGSTGCMPMCPESMRKKKVRIPRRTHSISSALHFGNGNGVGAAKWEEWYFKIRRIFQINFLENMPAHNNIFHFF